LASLFREYLSAPGSTADNNMSVKIEQRSLTEGRNHLSAGARQRQEQLGEWEEYIHSRSDPLRLVHGIQEDQTQRRILVALDIDQCSCLGEDTNDILRIISALTDGFNRVKSMADLLRVAQLLINPAMVATIDDIRRRGYLPYIVFYTSKSGILAQIQGRLLNTALHRAVRDLGLYTDERCETIRFKPANYRTAEDIRDNGMDYLYKQLPGVPPTDRVCHELRRVGLLTWAAALLLDLRYLPAVYITKGGKDMHLISRDIGVDFQRVILYDDRSDDHARNKGMTTMEAHMQPVPKYNFISMGTERAEALLSALTKSFPIPANFFETHPSLTNEASVAAGQWTEDRLALSEYYKTWNRRWPYIASEVWQVPPQWVIQKGRAPFMPIKRPGEELLHERAEARPRSQGFRSISDPAGRSLLPWP
jgi:hypothetical protein